MFRHSSPLSRILWKSVIWEQTFIPIPNKSVSQYLLLWMSWELVSILNCLFCFIHYLCAFKRKMWKLWIAFVSVWNIFRFLSNVLNENVAPGSKMFAIIFVVKMELFAILAQDSSKENGQTSRWYFDAVKWKQKFHKYVIFSLGNYPYQLSNGRCYNNLRFCFCWHISASTRHFQ